MANIEYDQGWRKGRADAIAEFQHQWQREANRVPGDHPVPNRMTEERNDQRMADTNTFSEEVSLFFDNGIVHAFLKFTALLDTGSPSCFIQAKFVPSAFLDGTLTRDEFVGLVCAYLVLCACP